MTRLLGGRWLGWTRLGAMFLSLSACQGESTPDDEDGDDDDPNGYCERLAGTFVRCDMGALVEDIDECEEPEDDEGRCSANCSISASCDELRMAICMNMRPPELDACWDSCLPPPFTCGSGESVPESNLCDGVPDCFDGSDEVGCPTFTCDSGEMVPEVYECDYYYDCADGSDEHVRCPDTFVCSNGAVVPEEWECDGAPDCLDGTDEHSRCPTVTCSDGTTALGARCDGIYDCLDASDEPASCPPTPLAEACGFG
jgi:hypothetical protein